DHIYMSELTETGNHLNHYLSPNIETLTGYPTEKLMSNRYFWPASMIHPDDRDLIAVKTERLVRGEDSELEYRLIRADGKVVWVRDSARVFQEGISSLVYGVLSDITKRHQLEEQLRQSQKMEAIGKLTGGIAHDFNNLLTVITGYSEFILHHNFNDPHQFHQDVQQIRNAAERAASLTRQLLAFSRQQILELRVLDLNDTVSNITKMLRRLIGEDIELITILNPVLNKVKADPGQLDQILLNLAVNARDAMPRGGQLTIETANVDLDAAYARRHADVTPGAYVMLAVTDTGAGMDKETQSHIFEPFFTTKEPGKGTGLGLATIYGIVKQSGGHIWVYSEPGQGTMFKIYLPRVDELAEVADRDHVTAEITPSVETVLLVEDEESVRKLAYRILHNIGFNVLNASNGSEALQMCERHQGPIHLLVTDLVMPGGMSGYDLAQRLMPLFPNIKILYMSGYADDSIVHQGVLDTGAAFLQKPFTPEALARKAREVLDERPEE
ncbi:MAG: ATP-binding protein, partial [Anaerolineae bacterium]|nr:ATP-binding protein [Anaerolineae bacterium]